MSEVPGDLKYTKDHEWARIEDDGTIVVGITEHAQQALGDLVYVELPEIGQDVTAGDGLAVVESVKAASDVYAPCDAVVEAVNEALADTPEKVNEDPYGDGWIAVLRPAASGALDELMDANDYDEYLLESESD